MIQTSLEPTCASNPANRTDAQDKLLGALIGLARSTFGNEYNLTDETAAVVISGLIAALAEDIDTSEVAGLLERAAQEKHRLVPGCATCAYPCGRTSDCDMPLVWRAAENICALKRQLLDHLGVIAAYAHKEAPVVGYSTQQVNELIYRVLFTVGEDWDPEYLIPVLTESKMLIQMYADA